MTSAINGKIIYKQAPRIYLDANIRSNSLAFDLTNERLLYSSSGTKYFEFYPGPHLSGWDNLQNIPIASNETSGVLTSSDWINFNSKADTSALSYINLNDYLPLSGGNVIGNISSNNLITNSIIITSGTSAGFIKADGSIDNNIYLTSLEYSSSSSDGIITSSDWINFNNKVDDIKLTSAIDNISTVPVDFSTFDNLNGANRKNRVWLHGSSSTSYCGTTFTLTKTTSGIFNETSNGYWFGVQSMYRSPFELALNTGIGGSVLSAHNITFSTIISSTSAEYFDIVVLQYMANDIANNIDVSAYTPIIESNIKTALQYGKKVILVVPHAKGGSSVSDADFNLRTIRYIDYRNWCYLQERRYNGLVYVADHYNVFNGERVPELYTDDGIHLNSFGAYKVAESWNLIVKRLGFNMPLELEGVSFGGIVIKELSGTGPGISISNVSGVYIEKDLFGRSQFSTTASTDLGTFFAGVTLTSGVYKMFVDFDCISNFPGSTTYSAGAKVTGGTPVTHRRIGIEGDGAITTGVRYQLLSAPFLVTETSVSYNLNFYSGGSSILRSLYLIKV